MQNGNGDKAPLGRDLRTVVFLVVVTVWALVTIADVFVVDYEVPAAIHMAALGIVGYFVGDRLKTRIDK